MVHVHRVREGHRRFKERFDRTRELFERLAKEGQRPTTLWIGCSDSRVVPELITGADPGELFIMRNIANLVPPSGTPGSDQAGAVIEYAVLGLAVSYAVVCGHTGCGGIRALGRGVDAAVSPHLARWIELAKPALEAGGGAGDNATRELASIQANVLLQCANLLTYPCVRERVAAGTLTVRGCLYDIHTGDLRVAGDAPDAWQLVTEL
jgi:carbonic anhydrase